MTKADEGGVLSSLSQLSQRVIFMKRGHLPWPWHCSSLATDGQLPWCSYQEVFGRGTTPAHPLLQSIL